MATEPNLPIDEVNIEEYKSFLINKELWEGLIEELEEEQVAKKIIVETIAKSVSGFGA